MTSPDDAYASDATCSSGTCSAGAATKQRTPTDRSDRCDHFAMIRDVEPGTDGCAECLALGQPWTELRVCLTCGHVGCCEDSPGRHAQTHFEETGHPLIVSYERLETWGWCYVHRRYFDPMPGPLPQRPYVWQAWLTRMFGRKKAPA